MYIHVEVMDRSGNLQQFVDTILFRRHGTAAGGSCWGREPDTGAEEPAAVPNLWFGRPAAGTRTAGPRTQPPAPQPTRGRGGAALISQ